MTINSIKLTGVEWNIIRAHKSSFFMCIIQEVCPIGRSPIINKLLLCLQYPKPFNEFRLKLKILFLLWRRRKLIKDMIVLSHQFFPHLIPVTLWVSSLFALLALEKKTGEKKSNSVEQRMQTFYTQPWVSTHLLH